jgi:site-specific DNA-cytosine methylase
MAEDLKYESGCDNLEEKLFRLRADEPHRVLDLFSGCGGMSLGLKRAEYTILGGVEIDQQAVTTYARNLLKDADEITFELHTYNMELNGDRFNKDQP